MRLTVSTCVLLFIAIVVGASALLLERFRPAAEVRGRTMRLPLFGDASSSASGIVLPSDPSVIILARDGEPPLRLEREGRQWVQSEPFLHPLSTHGIDEFLGVARRVRAVGRFDRARADAAQLGFDPPRAVLSLKRDDGDEGVTIEFGTRGLAGRAFLRLKGREEIFVTDAALHEVALAADPREWRDRRIFHYGGADSSEISIRSGELFIQLQREGRTWRMVSPARSRTNEPAIDRLLEDIGRARSTGFLVDDPADLLRFGLTEPSGEILIRSRRLVAASGEAEAQPVTERLLVGARMGASTQDRFGLIEGRPVVVRIPESVLRVFFRSPLDFVAMNASDVVRGDVRSITIRPSDGAAPRSYERDMDAWRSAESGEAVSTRSAEGLLGALIEVQASRVELQPWPRTIERAIITLWGWTGDPIATIRVARAAADTAGGAPQPWIMDNGDNVLRIYPPSLELPELGGAW